MTNTFASRTALTLTAAQLKRAEAIYAAEYAAHLPVAQAYCRDGYDANAEASRMAYRAAVKGLR